MQGNRHYMTITSRTGHDQKQRVLERHLWRGEMGESWREGETRQKHQQKRENGVQCQFSRIPYQYAIFLAHRQDLLHIVSIYRVTLLPRAVA